MHEHTGGREGGGRREREREREEYTNLLKFLPNFIGCGHPFLSFLVALALLVWSLLSSGS
jgi:hypothetical protein